MGIPSYMPWNLGMTLGITLSYTWLILCMRTRLVLDHNLARAPIIGSIPTYPIGYQKNQFWYITVILKTSQRPRTGQRTMSALSVVWWFQENDPLFKGFWNSQEPATLWFWKRFERLGPTSVWFWNTWELNWPTF